MILARISRAIREQNWFAVAIELCVVAAGVVIGFGVTGWAERQANQTRGDLYLERLVADMGENRRRFTDARDFRMQVREKGVEALTYANGSRQPSEPWRVAVAYFNASQAGGAEGVDATYREMVATGDLRLLTDLNLRGRLSAYYSNSGFARITDELPGYREDVRAIIPLTIQSYIWENCYESVSGRIQRLRDCDAPAIVEAELASLALRLIQDESLNGRLRYWVSTQSAAISIHEHQITMTNDMLERLQQSRGANGGDQ